MIKRRNTIITVILVMAVLTVGTSIFLVNQSNAATISNTITQQGTKINLINNNNQLWEHMDLIIPNAATSNGSKQSYYIEAFVKPGGNLTIDLSNILGYGNTPLSKESTLTVLSWSGLFSNTVTGTGDFSMGLQGWSSTFQNVNAPMYNITQENLPIGPLPSSIINSTALIGTNPSDVEVTGDNDSYEPLFAEMLFTVDPSSNLVITFPVPPTLCQVIAHEI